MLDPTHHEIGEAEGQCIMITSLSRIAVVIVLSFSGTAMAQTSNTPCGTMVPAPKGLFDTPLRSIPPVEMFRVASGYYCEALNILPTMYAHSGNKIVVLGPGYEKEFDLANIEEASKAWRALLKSQGYAPTPSR